jgi:hypothetical protein
MAAVSQLRVMGGAIVLAIATSVFNSYTRPKIAVFEQAAHLNGTPVTSAQLLTLVDGQTQEQIKGILARGYNLQMFVLCAFAAAQMPTAMLLWRKKQLRV